MASEKTLSMLFQRKAGWCVCVFFYIFLMARWELQNSMKTTFQKLQTLEQTIKNIPRAVGIYHDHHENS